MKIFLNIPEIKGDAATTGYAGQIECQTVSYEVQSPRDPATGLAAGRRRHAPIRIVKAWDKSSPLLAQAVIGNTVYPKATFTFVGETPSFGAKHLVIELTNARVLAVEQAGTQGGATFPVESVMVSFIGIDLTYSAPGATSKKVSDSTTAP